MRTKYKPSWHEGIETRKEEANWPYATSVIANQNIITQNIGTLKAMARDKAKNRRKDVPIVVHLPGGAEYTIVFHPDGRQEMTDIKE